MYAVIRTGGKQYRVAPGDVLRVEKLENTDGKVEFTDVLATSSEGAIAVKPGSAKVVASVVKQDRADKILVFHFKRKKQYKKLQGHRQAFTEIRINEIHVDGKSFTAANGR
ncbi:MAG TPA: 50S ribosomal protein L21 [Acidobacteriaceae bacterium]|jgi:large subunit ribosomal protein L21|nr:50S ribosomal protein L21 [Acidobacteriaceae bacterium]